MVPQLVSAVFWSVQMYIKRTACMICTYSVLTILPHLPSYLINTQAKLCRKLESGEDPRALIGRLLPATEIMDKSPTTVMSCARSETEAWVSSFSLRSIECRLGLCWSTSQTNASGVSIPSSEKILNLVCNALKHSKQ